MCVYRTHATFNQTQFSYVFEINHDTYFQPIEQMSLLASLDMSYFTAGLHTQFDVS